MQYLLKSRMYREELLRWILIIVLALWALTVTVAYLRSRPQTIVIGVSDDASYLIETRSQSHEAKEKLTYLKAFIANYYSFNEKNYDAKMSRAGDSMSQDLWQSKQAEILKIKASLASNPYSQEIKLLSVDDLGDGKIEALTMVMVRRKLNVTPVKLKISLKVEAKARDQASPYPFEVTELSDATL
ncbi:MAG: hypothetical protein EOP06_02085 [Proteobacteria bacterium]|nr:MAG: hypothetical protein EOP06_02085 [Pseudomonadota bacterium]